MGGCGGKGVRGGGGDWRRSKLGPCAGERSVIPTSGSA